MRKETCFSHRFGDHQFHKDPQTDPSLLRNIWGSRPNLNVPPPRSLLKSLKCLFDLGKLFSLILHERHCYYHISAVVAKWFLPLIPFWLRCFQTCLFVCEQYTFYYCHKRLEMKTPSLLGPATNPYTLHETTLDVIWLKTAKKGE